MQISIKRTFYTEECTEGILFFGSERFCDTLEDCDRMPHGICLPTDETLKEIKRVKVPGKTAIPAGRYELVMSMSSRFKRELPEVLGVPGFTGIRIHPGNTTVDSEGCILLGFKTKEGAIGNSQAIVRKFIERLADIPKGEKIELTIG